MKILVLEPCGLHTAYLGCYGSDWVATPNLDRLAAEGIVFDQHIVDRPELALDLGLLQRSAGTGRYMWPGAEGIVAALENGPVVTLPGGIRCRRLICTTFEDFGRAAKAVYKWKADDCPILWLEGPRLVPPWDLSEDILNIYTGEDVAPWPEPALGKVDLSPEDLLRLQDTYAAVVTYWDALLGILLDDMRDSGLLDEVVVWVTARGSLPLGEHGQVGVAASCLHDEVVHVPLVWRLPSAADAGLRVLALTQPVDLLPTLGEMLGVPSGDAQGSTLRPLVLGQKEEVRPYACAALRLGDEEEWLLRTPAWAFHLPLVRTAEARLYVKPDDRWEVNDVRTHHAALAERLEVTLRAFADVVRRPGPLVYAPLYLEDSAR